MNPLQLPALISPYVGGKGGIRYFRQFGKHWQSLICDRLHHYDVIVEPFAGSGAATWQHNHGIQNAIAADFDPGVQAVWECWGDAEKRGEVEKYLASFHRLLSRNPDSAYRFLKACYNQHEGRSREHLAAVSLTLRRLVFGATLRTAKTTGKLNVALSKSSSAKTGSKLDRYLDRWNYTWPDNGIQTLDFHHSWQEAVQALADSNYGNALVIIDPPYYSPKGWTEKRKDGRKVQSRMTPAYPGHDPQSADELAMCVDCLDAVLATGKAGRVVVFNYASGILEDSIDELYGKYCFDDDIPYSSANLGPLGNMNNAQKFHGRDKEWAWEIGGSRMFQGCDSVKQLTLV
ncbi:MAG: DNA adenine methylase [Cyanobacteria bacterium P01_F01_bin.56]